MWCFGEGVSWWPWFGGVSMFIFWIGLIALIVWGVIAFTRSNRHDSKFTPIEIAKERYAKGEITKEEYEQYKKNLS